MIPAPSKNTTPSPIKPITYPIAMTVISSKITPSDMSTTPKLGKVSSPVNGGAKNAPRVKSIIKKPS